jgi:hypothetical protein
MGNLPLFLTWATFLTTANLSTRNRYAVANQAYYAMKEENTDQCVRTP